MTETTMGGGHPQTFSMSHERAGSLSGKDNPSSPHPYAMDWLLHRYCPKFQAAGRSHHPA